MKRLTILAAFLVALIFVSQTVAQNRNRETYTGTVISFGTGLSTRTVTRTFTLNITGQTNDERTQAYLGILQDRGQDALKNSINDADLGRFSLTGQLGTRLNVVRESNVDGRRRIFIVFERWTQFAEARGGYRSLDYPFGVIEIFIDPRTGKGEGTYIAAARIRFDNDKNRNQVEIENFGTYPARLIGVQRRNS